MANNGTVKFICPKCIVGDMIRRKCYDRNKGRRKYAYVCTDCGLLKYFEVE